MKRVLLILTGGTISMVKHQQTGALYPADLATFKTYVPELATGNIQVDTVSFDPLIDSSDISIHDWVKMAQTVYDNYNDYDGFVILHGTDTMAYSASALSFMFEDLNKPVILTGSQLPIGVLRSDARENLLTAIEIAAEQDADGDALVPEVCIFFEDKLMRGNRCTKRNAEHFSAFKSYNYPSLAKAGVHITYNIHLVHYNDPRATLKLHTRMDCNVAVLKLFPGITKNIVHTFLNAPGLRGIVLETYGAGNAPSRAWLYEELKDAISRGIIIVNKTQCLTGSVNMELYEVAQNLVKAGVLSGRDITTEALLTKMMLLLGECEDNNTVIQMLQKNICGEITME